MSFLFQIEDAMLMFDKQTNRHRGKLSLFYQGYNTTNDAIVDPNKSDPQYFPSTYLILCIIINVLYINKTMSMVA